MRRAIGAQIATIGVVLFLLADLVLGDASAESGQASFSLGASLNPLGIFGAILLFAGLAVIFLPFRSAGSFFVGRRARPERSPFDDVEPIRSETFGVEGFEAHALSLAGAQHVEKKRSRGRPLLPRVEDNGRVLRETCRSLSLAARDDRSIVPAAEWLIDNFRLVDEQLREIRDDLPAGFYRELPKLVDGHLEGYPRVYGIAWAFVAHADSRFDPHLLRGFLSAYQRVQPLTIGELWAVTISLRIVLVENLRRLSDDIVRGRALRKEADSLADDLLGVSAGAPIPGIGGLARFENCRLKTAFAVQLVQRFRDQDPEKMPALKWLEARLAAQGVTSESIVRVELDRQSAMNVTVRNIIMSMGLISALDWTEFFESVSLVDRMMKAIPSYAGMDFATRDAYRHAIEELARGSHRDELEVARTAIDLASESGTPDGRHDDPGYYIVGDGRSALETKLAFRPTWSRRILRAYLAAATVGYLGTAAVISAGFLGVLLYLGSTAGASSTALVFLAILAAFPASDLAMSLVNRFVAAVVKPRILSRLDLSGGVTSNLRTLVVVPTLLTSVKSIVDQTALLEVHYLANTDVDIRFAILSDWVDAATETLPDDDMLLDVARREIAELNRRHPPEADGGHRFLLFHRRRLRNESEKVWMGWERKRGKLFELNRLLRGAEDTTYLDSNEPAMRAPKSVRYVVTLDSDTRLPRLAVKRLVGTMAHPLNRPGFDADNRRVVDGYGVLQPRVTPPLPGRKGSIYQRLSSGRPGIDPYASAVSDVYQDLFGEGSFTGKGIYDVDAFMTAMAGRVPDNSLLSHDLFEGVFARAGLVTDVEVFESAPSHYGVACARQHRWARGDWQLLPWIFGPNVPSIGRWKMIDNLRRSLSAPATVALLLGAWLTEMSAPGAWTTFVVCVTAIPAFLPVLNGLWPHRRGISKRSHVRAVGRDIAQSVMQTAFQLTMTAHQADLMTDAIARTLVRLSVTRCRLLEWLTAADAKSALDLSVHGFLRRMYGASVIGGAALLLVAIFRPEALPYAAPIAMLWIASPLIALRISRPGSIPLPAVLHEDDEIELRSIARRTWCYFSTFVGPADHFLPPDNFQEDPREVVAHRTSPTNIGLYLLATVSARDFGWIGLRETVDRLEATLATMAKMERMHGHFFNWYGTTDLAPLEPRYISSVDSGNLAGHLTAVGRACREMIVTPIHRRCALRGIEDAARLACGIDADVPSRSAESGLREIGGTLRDFLPTADTDPDPSTWSDKIRSLLATAMSLDESAKESPSVVDSTTSVGPAEMDGVFWRRALEATIRSHVRDLDVVASVEDLLFVRLGQLAQAAEDFARAMDFAFLFDPVRKLFSIGYRCSDGTLDPGHYDLLASEARLASFLAIANHRVPVSHWFRLGRVLTPIEGDSIVVSWSGSMFEYLMPLLVMRAPAGSLLEQTCRLVVRRQIAYGRERRLPWGVSESAYNARDLEMTYQYSNFGVPGLGYRRGLADESVVAPYATALAAMFDPRAAVLNFRRLRDAGARGRYGFYEALDYTAARLPEGRDVVIVRTYMAHHQGMSLVAIGNVVHDGLMRSRFHAEPSVRATELLLEERTPRDVAVAKRPSEDVPTGSEIHGFVPPVVRRFTSTDESPPRTHVLSNGRYSVMMTAAGSGYSRFGSIAVNRWSEDATSEATGCFVYLKDVYAGKIWSAADRPLGGHPENYEAVFSEDRAKIVRRDGEFTTTLDLLVSPEDDVEIRRISVVNLGARTREIELTSYFEIVLATPAADGAHRAFSSLFVETECLPEKGAILATRRRRSPEEPIHWMAHVVACLGDTVGDLEWETDRGKFIGRGRTPASPAAVFDGRKLTNSVGAVLDPIASLRRRVRIPPGKAAHVTFSTMIAASREDLLVLVEKYRDASVFDRVATLAWTTAQVQLRHLGIRSDDAHLYQSLARHMIFSDRALRSGAEKLARPTAGAADLWPNGISGDLPILLVEVDDPDDLGLVRQILHVHEYWRLKRLSVDLVILNEKGTSYVQDLQVMLEALLRTSRSHATPSEDKSRGGVFILRSDRIPGVQRDALKVAARVVLSSRRGTLSEQVSRAKRRSPPVEREQDDATATPSARRPKIDARGLEFWNGLGGFAANGNEYVIHLGPGAATPAPWINVCSNGRFGFQVSESGAGYTWSVNSRENQLTPWSNDPVEDPPGEIIYIGDIETGELWTPTASPIRRANAIYSVRHGRGWSRFTHASHGIDADLELFVPLDDCVKVSRLTLKNTSGVVRRLSVTAYVAWVIGTDRSKSAPHVVTEIVPGSNAIFAKNVWAGEHAGRVAFLDLGGRQSAWTGDRTEFLGRNGSPDRPAALRSRRGFSGRVGAGYDPCGAMQAVLRLEPGATLTINVFLGDAADRPAAIASIARLRGLDLLIERRRIDEFWTKSLGSVGVATPDRSFDLMLNGRLLYQAIACRVWARSAFYQAGGAYGFRDQLQDVVALATVMPIVAREHIVRAAARQFPEGDVQHWWHPPSGRGVRTRISDDALWLPYAVVRYVESTGDSALWEESVNFLEGARLSPDEAESYFLPRASDQAATVYEHCARAVDRSLEVGIHGLPLIGTGDWNDGMNRIGRLGKGESVWLGWFLIRALEDLAPIAEGRGETDRAAKWRRHALSVASAIEKEAWDGAWYRRAFFDDGTVLGTSTAQQCRLDSIAQSWSVIAKAAPIERARTAMASVSEILIRPQLGVCVLLFPPFDHANPDPGYIAGYPPGVRENGGQYTHAALWSVIALAELGEGDRAFEMFSLLNPIRHTSTAKDVATYRVEPYVVAADVVSVGANAGRGGWTWYTGSAGWMHRAGLEWILGFRLFGDRFEIDPCIPAGWSGFTIEYRFKSTLYVISIVNPHGVAKGVVSVDVDGVFLDPKPKRIGLLDDGVAHAVRVVMGRP